MRLRMTLAGLGLAMMLGAGNASAFETLRTEIIERVKAEHCRNHPAKCATTAQAVPEMDVTAGTKAIALALGLLLLGAETLRRRAGRVDQ